jgi:hypothetical protein
MNKATVVADLAKVGFYSEEATTEIKKDPFGVAAMASHVLNMQSSLLRIITEMVTDSTVVTSEEGAKLQRLGIDLTRVLSNIQ